MPLALYPFLVICLTQNTVCKCTGLKLTGNGLSLADLSNLTLVLSLNLHWKSIFLCPYYVALDRRIRDHWNIHEVRTSRLPRPKARLRSTVDTVQATKSLHALSIFTQPNLAFDHLSTRGPSFTGWGCCGLLYLK